jgi:hypothetical protein
MGSDPSSLWNEAGLRLQGAYPGDELVVRFRAIVQNWDGSDLQRRQKVTVHLLARTDAEQNTVSRQNLLLPQFERKKISESIQRRISQHSVS